MRRLRAVSAIFAAAACLDAKQTAALHLLAAPMLKVHSPALRNQIEQRLVIEGRELIKLHRVPAMLNRKSKIENRKLIHPLTTVGNEDRQFLHHELRFPNGTNHVRARGAVPFLGHALAGMTAPTPDVSAAREIAPIDLGQLVLVQPRFTGTIDVVAVIEHETSPVRMSKIFKVGDFYLIARLA